MYYRAVENRCAVDLSGLRVSISNERALAILLEHGFKVLPVDPVLLAEECVGRAKYLRGVTLSEAPGTVDCSGFVKWLYGMRGVWLPRRTIQQHRLGKDVGLDCMIAGDLIFGAGAVNYYDDDPSQGVGHVGIVTSDHMVIHATWNVGVVKESLDKFCTQCRFRGIRRFIPQDQKILTLETPLEREVESSDDIRWIILQSLPE